MNRRMRFLLVTAVMLLLVSAMFAECMLYEVQGGKNKVYLLGSIHLMPEDAYPLNPAIPKAFEDSDVLVVELDASTIDQAQLQQFIVENALLKGENRLHDMLDPKVYRSLTEKMEGIGIPQAQMDMFRPWFVSMSLGMGLLQKLGLQAELGVDMHYLAKAHEKNMPIIELETIMSQMQMLSSLPDSVQVDYLSYSIDDYDKIDEFFGEMLEAWKTGDAEVLDKLSKGKMKEAAKELPGMMDYYGNLFTDRDNEMLKKIAGFANNEEDHTYFVIVGSFHLVGDDGIIKRLKEQNLKAKQF